MNLWKTSNDVTLRQIDLRLAPNDNRFYIHNYEDPGTKTKCLMRF